MEEIQKEIVVIKNRTVCIIGSNSNSGRKVVGTNISAELSRKGFNVIYGASIDEDTGFELNEKTEESLDDEKQISLYKSQITHLNILTFSKKSSQLSPEKMEELITYLPEKIKDKSDFFVFSIKETLGFPDRYMLLIADIFIMVVKAEATAFSNIFQQLEKLSFIPRPPKKIFLIFNKTRDLEFAYDSYKNIIKEAEELNIHIEFIFLGIVPNDPVRQQVAGDSDIPLINLFPNSMFSSYISFITNKLINESE